MSHKRSRFLLLMLLLGLVLKSSDPDVVTDNSSFLTLNPSDIFQYLYTAKNRAKYREIHEYVLLYL